MSEVDVIIEISKSGHIKYEYDKEKISSDVIEFFTLQ
jgi:inorganic pyrophosphatase